MKFSELSNIYDEISRAGNDAKRVKLLAETFKNIEEKDLRTIAHFTLGELVEPELSDRLAIGPATLKEQIAALAKKDLTGAWLILSAKSRKKSPLRQ